MTRTSRSSASSPPASPGARRWRARRTANDDSTIRTTKFMQTRREFLQLGAAGALGLALPRAFAKGAATRAWSVVETSRDGARLAPGTIAGAATSSAATLSCDPSKRFQQITGFGGALTESSAYVLKQLPEAQRLEVLKRYYDVHEGIGYTLARTHIGSCDFSLS